MDDQDWFFSVGPIDADRAYELRRKLQHAVGNSLQVDVVDPRLWFSFAWDIASVSALISVLEAALVSETLSADLRHATIGVLSDLRTWLASEYDGTLDPSGDEQS